ncbi:MAG: hypothetical protein M3083_25385 [Actinomycetota bacterium]|nr:hypothetical protein [Actinomycetota bacterium]MDQ6948576.1 hypothetical protein [Actinomycetota bacterium]
MTARATCPQCGAGLSYEDRRRVLAGEPETPPLSVSVTNEGTVELSAAGLFIPLVVHQCEGVARAR